MKTLGVSIGLPVRNGGDYLRIALDSLLAQNYEDFELIISDNASDDGTPSVCLEYARRDARIRCLRLDTNVGAAANFNRVFRLSRAKYFMWAAHDDRWHPSYVRQCREALEEDPNVVLCASNIRFIDEGGVELDDATYRSLISTYNRLDTRSMGLVGRVKELSNEINWYAIYGLIRADSLRQTRLFRDAYGSDALLLLELLLRGETMILSDTLFDYRLIRKAPERQLEDISGVSSRSEILKPYTSVAKGLLDVIAECNFSASIKAVLREDLMENVKFCQSKMG